MARTLLDAFTRYQHAQVAARSARKRVREELEDNGDWMEMTQKIDDLREKRTKVKVALLHGTKLQEVVDEANAELQAAKELLSDLAINGLAKGQDINVELPGAKFVPEFSAKYKQLRFKI